MVAEHGWNYFRAAERDFLASLLPPGGGAIQHREVWEKLMETAPWTSGCRRMCLA